MKRATIASLLMFCVSQLVFAEDLVPPPWANDTDPSFTRQVWEFDSDPGTDPILPEVDENPFGTPTITFSGSGISWQDMGGNTAYGTDLKQGVLMAAMPGDNMQIYLPNQQSTYKSCEIWIQLTFATLNVNAESNITSGIIPTYTDGASGTVERSDFYQIESLVNLGSSGANWFQLAEEWVISLQPDSQVYSISLNNDWPVGYPLWLDEVVIYTHGISDLVPGDANGDGVVSADDYTAVRDNFGNTGAPGITGDANLDGVVSADDYASIQANFGNSDGTTAVPEPATISLLVLGGISFLRRKRK